jgi:hypothetical protein
MDQLPLERFLERFVLTKLFYCFSCQKLAFLWGEVLIMGNREFLKSLINLFWNDSLYASTCVFDLEIEI